MSFIKRYQDVEKLAHKLARKGWRVVRIGMEHEDGDKPLVSITLQYDPEQLSDVL